MGVGRDDSADSFLLFAIGFEEANNFDVKVGFAFREIVSRFVLSVGEIDVAVSGYEQTAREETCPSFWVSVAYFPGEGSEGETRDDKKVVGSDWKQSS